MICYATFNQHLQDLKQIVPAIAEIFDRLDPETRHHCERLAITAQQFGEYLALSARDRQLLVWGAYLHDIGKVAIPVEVLLKPTTLTATERQTIQKHTVIGEVICPLPASMHEVSSIIRHHHELWNGTGYPDRLLEEEIPYLARVLQILDVYDALTHERCYKRAYSPTEAIAILFIETTKGYYQTDLVAEFMTFLEIEDNFGDRSSIVDFMTHTNISNRAMHHTGYPVNLFEELDHDDLQAWEHLFALSSNAIKCN